MSLTPSTMLEFGTKAPSFELLDTVSGVYRSLQQLKSDKATVVMFICNHCPYVVHIIEKLSAVARAYVERGVSFIAISANDVTTHPADAPDKMTVFAKQYQLCFPYLYDETQHVAQAYEAACTPDFYVFDKQLSCVYRGRFDESTPGNHKPVTGSDLTHALDCLLDNKSVNTQQHPSMGCNIKWRDYV